MYAAYICIYDPARQRVINKNHTNSYAYYIYINYYVRNVRQYEYSY